MRKAFRYASLAFVTLVLSPVLGDFFVELARQRGFYENPEGVIGSISKIWGSPWYQWFACVVLGLALGLWFDRFLKLAEKRKLPKLSYSLQQGNNTNSHLWYIVLHNSGHGATFGAFLNMSGLNSWQGAPVGTVQCTWKLNEAVPLRKIETSEAAPLPVFSNGLESVVFFCERSQFELAKRDAEAESNEESMELTFFCEENREWRKRISISISGPRPVITNSDLPSFR
ncbi:hypothetical protein [Shinella sp.]|uniref:hypothetical protein n=1 Tax=Shinella sp. TaxID=1870904 RepID=UPI003F717072